MEYITGSLLAALYIVLTGIPTSVVVWVERDEGHHYYVSALVAAVLGIVPSVVFYIGTPQSETFVSVWGRVLLWATASTLLYVVSFMACILSERQDARRGELEAPIKAAQMSAIDANIRKERIGLAIKREDYLEARRLQEGGSLWERE